jgi:hypothetical protein
MSKPLCTPPLWPRLLAVALLATTAHAHAAVSLSNTGVDNGGGVVATGAVDTHFVLLSAGGALPTYAADDALGYPGYWLGPSSTSKWITPLITSGFAGDVAPGDYIYQTSFDLSGINLTTASLQGLAAADNEITAVLLNGASIGFSAFGYSALAPFVISSGFVPGFNTLAFVVNNSGGPSGLRAELTGNFVAAPPVPEPAASVLMACGAMGLMAWTLSRTRRRA